MTVAVTILIHSRRLLLQEPNTTINLHDISQTTSSLSPATTPIASDAAAAGAAVRAPFSLDSSMTLTILVLLTVIFFMGFFSFFINRSTTTATTIAAVRHTSAPTTTAAPRGLHPTLLKSLPLTAYGSAVETANTDDCSICLSEFIEGESVKLIPFCGHVFHPRCVDTWLSTHVTCPLCRSARLFKSGTQFRRSVHVDEG